MSEGKAESPTTGEGSLGGERGIVSDGNSEDGDGEEDDDGGGKSKKKARKEKKEARREKKGSKREREKAANAKEPQVTSPPAGVRRRTPRFSSPQKETTFQSHIHVYNREHVTASTTLTAEDKYSKLTMKIRGLLTKGQKVDDKFAIETIEMGNKKGRWEKPSQVPFNYIELGANVMIPENAKFEPVRPWGKNAKKVDGTDADLKDPEVYVTFCFLCDKDP